MIFRNVLNLGHAGDVGDSSPMAGVVVWVLVVVPIDAVVSAPIYPD